MSTEISQIGRNLKVIKLKSGGITNPSIDTLQKLAKVLDVSVDDLDKSLDGWLIKSDLIGLQYNQT